MKLSQKGFLKISKMRIHKALKYLLVMILHTTFVLCLIVVTCYLIPTDATVAFGYSFATHHRRQELFTNSISIDFILIERYVIDTTDNVHYVILKILVLILEI